MRRTIISVVAALAITACSDYHTSDNGPIDGLWQLTNADTLGGKSADVRSKMIFWAVQANLLEMRDHTEQLAPPYTPNVFFRFTLADGLLRVYSPVADARSVSDSIVTDPATLRPYGLNALEETYKVLRLESRHMTLESPTLRLYFRKY